MRRAVLAGVVVAACVVAIGLAVAAPPGGAASPPGVAGAEPSRAVRGEVSRVNEGRGTLTLKTADGDVELQLPPGVVKGIRKGDRLTVRLAVRGAVPGTARSDAPGRSAAGAKSP
jgi:hypothetical protein